MRSGNSIVGMPGTLGAVAVALLMAPGEAPGQGAAGVRLERVYYDMSDANGRLSGGFTEIPMAVPEGAAGRVNAPVTTITDNGPSANRIDLVFVGDGYLDTQLGLYAVHVNNGFHDLFDQEPFASYMTFFNVHRVDVVSNESGVDNDPVAGIDRDTALDMGFWCGGIERFLCVNVGTAYEYAASAPEVDHVLAVANSSKYGGAGYTGSNLATFSGGNGIASEIAIHEIGHSLGKLADEYDNANGQTYTGPEPPVRNVSIFDAATMADAGRKWAAWLGDPGIGHGGLVGTYEGAFRHEFGIFRPTSTSKMRTLGRPFNLPSAEGLILEIYKIVDPIDDSTPTGHILAATDTVFVDPMDPVGHSLEVAWSLDASPIPNATAATLELGGLGMGLGVHELSVTVTDRTPLVRDEIAREIWMTRTLTWDVFATVPGDMNGDFLVDWQDFDLLLQKWGSCGEPCPPACHGDFDGDCIVGSGDFLIMLRNWG
ncbi:MAG: M64 family metallopeptidase [Planctomycetota bacterium]|jgi:hypothetical protein